MPWGRFIFGHIPLRRPVVTVGKLQLLILISCWHIFLVGKPIHVNQNINSTSEDIDKLHKEYIQAVEQLFEVNKNKYGLGHVKLEIV
jgi:hypothetical protein